MENKVNNCTTQGKDELGIYTVVYKRDMDDLGKRIKDSITKKVNQSKHQKPTSWEIYSTS